MGDFNGFFKKDEPFEYMGQQFSAVKGSDKLPLSCCYNFNSSCPENMRSGKFRSIFNAGNPDNQMEYGKAYLIGTNEAHATDFAKNMELKI